ncbi:MAG: succinylglutamate desuccinylase/aspartoacylase family protein [Magnetococcales bacterium]|nr:succinylglutamate desuccinylase/aspartoacylase family protein [Magnetococcales bacterium]
MAVVLLLWLHGGIFPHRATAAEPPLSFQDEVQELVKEAASQSTVVQDGVKKEGEKRATLTVHESCLKIGAKLSSVDYEACMASGLQPTGSDSVEGIPILLKTFTPLPRSSGTPEKSNSDTKPPQARVLLIGGVHGDEYSSVSIVFKWMKLLEKNHTTPFHWHIVPLVNPDGLLRSQSTRTNARGVDLNRNFPTRDWKEDSADYWVRRTGKDPRRFPGKFPLSEPESQWLVEEIKKFRPNVIVSIHAPFGLLDFDGPPTTPPERLGPIYLSLLGTYPGSLGRYAVESLKIPIITIELPHAGILPTAAEIESIWSDLIGWIRGHVFDRMPPVQSSGPLSGTEHPLPVVDHPLPVVGQPPSTEKTAPTGTPAPPKPTSKSKAVKPKTDKPQQSGTAKPAKKTTSTTP